MVILDVTVVNIALPSISRALNFSATDLQWVVTVYVLFTGGLMLLGDHRANRSRIAQAAATEAAGRLEAIGQPSTAGTLPTLLSYLQRSDEARDSVPE